MKVYFHPTGFTMIGKAKHIRGKLSEYITENATIQQLLQANLQTMKESDQAYKHDHNSFTILNRF